MVNQDTTVLDAPANEEAVEAFPQITMDEGEPSPAEEENPRNADPPPAESEEPSTPPDPGGEDDDEGDIKPGTEWLGDSTQ